MFRKAPKYGLVILFSLAFHYTSYWITHPWTCSYISYTEEERLNLLPSAELFNPINWWQWKWWHKNRQTNTDEKHMLYRQVSATVLTSSHFACYLSNIYPGLLGAWGQKVGSETIKRCFLHSPLSPGWPGASCQACLLRCWSCFSASPVLCQA